MSTGDSEIIHNSCTSAT